MDILEFVLSMAWWNNNWDIVSGIAPWITAVAIIIGFIIASWQIRELKRSRHVELCTYFCDKFENLNEDKIVVEFRTYLDNLSFIDKCKKECIYEGKDEIEIPEEISEKILCDYKEKFSDKNPLDKICNFFEKLGILWKGKIYSNRTYRSIFWRFHSVSLDMSVSYHHI